MQEAEDGLSEFSQSPGHRGHSSESRKIFLHHTLDQNFDRNCMLQDKEMTVDLTSLRPSEAFEELHKKELQFYLFGLHIGKSKAPLILNSTFENLGLKWRYNLEETDSKDVFNQHLEQDNCVGAAVTMPNKVNFISEIDVLDNVGAGVSSINCVYTRKTSEGNIVKVGTNTDTIGIQESFLNNEEALPFLEKSKGKAGLIYGGGGASRSAVYALIKLLGCSHVYIVNRDKQ